jgi:hypothetical protein
MATQSQKYSLFLKTCSLATLKRVAKDFKTGAFNKPKKKQKHPWRKIDPEMAATTIRRLTANNAHHSPFRRQRLVSLKAVQNVLKKMSVMSRCKNTSIIKMNDAMVRAST